MAKSLLHENGEIVALVKPQFEAGREKVGKKGIVREKSTHIEVLNEIIKFSSTLELGVKNLLFSPITGSKGNIEFLLHLKNNRPNYFNENLIYNVVEESHNILR